jgi:hypothetical protein
MLTQFTTRPAPQGSVVSQSGEGRVQDLINGWTNSAG